LLGVAESAAVAARALGGPRAEQALGGLIALALFTSASSMLLSGPRVYARMACDGVLPAALGRLHGDHPRIAILAQAALSLIVIWVAGLREAFGIRWRHAEPVGGRGDRGMAPRRMHSAASHGE